MGVVRGRRGVVKRVGDDWREQRPIGMRGGAYGRRGAGLLLNRWFASGPQYEPRGVSCREAVNECDIAETCTGDSSQVRSSRCPAGPLGKPTWL